MNASTQTPALGEFSLMTATLIEMRDLLFAEAGIRANNHLDLADAGARINAELARRAAVLTPRTMN
jgi:hypothetical protein